MAEASIGFFMSEATNTVAALLIISTGYGHHHTHTHTHLSLSLSLSLSLLAHGHPSSRLKRHSPHVQQLRDSFETSPMALTRQVRASTLAPPSSRSSSKRLPPFSDATFTMT